MRFVSPKSLAFIYSTAVDKENIETQKEKTAFGTSSRFQWWEISDNLFSIFYSAKIY